MSKYAQVGTHLLCYGKERHIWLVRSCVSANMRGSKVIYCANRTFYITEEVLRDTSDCGNTHEQLCGAN